MAERKVDLHQLVRKISAFLLAMSVAGLSRPGWTNEPKVWGLNELRIPYEHKHGVSVITGRGKKILELPAKQLTGANAEKDVTGERKLAYGFSSPHIHPRQDRIVCRRCHGYFPQQDPRGVRCELVEVSLESGTSPVRVIYAPPDDRLIASPAWSPDGHQVAFLLIRPEDLLSEVAILDRESQNVVQRFTVEELKAFVYFDYLRWSADGRRIFIWGTRAKPDYKGVTNEDIAILTISSGNVQWLGQWGGTGRYGIVPIDGRYAEEGRREYGEWKQKIETPADAETVRTLFGSAEKRVNRPIWSPDRRYYFYYRYREGFGANGWIERYDAQIDKGVRIKTVWWAPYVE